VARRPGPSFRALLFGCGAGAVLGQTAKKQEARSNYKQQAARSKKQEARKQQEEEENEEDEEEEEEEERKQPSLLQVKFVPVCLCCYFSHYRSKSCKSMAPDSLDSATKQDWEPLNNINQVLISA